MKIFSLIMFLSCLTMAVINWVNNQYSEATYFIGLAILFKMDVYKEDK